MTEDQLIILKQKLATEFVPQLPPLLDLTKPPDQMAAKNVSRAFNAFAIQKITGLDTISAANSVVDDYEDNGIDLVYYHQPTKKLFLVQGKLKADDPFSLEEANAFILGVRDLINQLYSRFNINFQNRQTEIDSALDEADEIVLVAAHTSDLLSQHARDAINNFLTNDKPDDRLAPTFIDYGPAGVLNDLLAERAAPVVNDEIVIMGGQKIDAPRVTYFGRVSLLSLIGLYTRHGNALFEKNIRYSLGVGSSDVNRAILETLGTNPSSFFYLSNGVTAISNTIYVKGPKDNGRRFEFKGFSVINGVQTIATSKHFVDSNPGVDISRALVMLTLIQVDAHDTFSLEVTRARNHQNPISPANFAALDGNQERLRRELAFLGVTYRFRPEAHTAPPGLDVITIDESAVALALFHPDPGMPVVLKREPSSLLNTQGADYRRLFYPDLSGRRLANAVRFYRQASKILGSNERAASGWEKLIYRHGAYAIMWLTFRANSGWADLPSVTEASAATMLSLPLDAWRNQVHIMAGTDLPPNTGKGPLAFFRNSTDTKPFVCKLRDAGV